MAVRSSAWLAETQCMDKTLDKVPLGASTEQTPVIFSRPQALFSCALVWVKCDHIADGFSLGKLREINEISGAVCLPRAVGELKCENAAAHARLANRIHLTSELHR